MAPFDVYNHIRGHVKHFEPGRGRRALRKPGPSISCGLDFSRFPGACRQSRLLGEGHRSWIVQPPPSPFSGPPLSMGLCLVNINLPSITTDRSRKASPCPSRAMSFKVSTKQLGLIVSAGGAHLLEAAASLSPYPPLLEKARKQCGQLPGRSQG